MPWGIDKTDCSDKFTFSAASFAFWLDRIALRRRTLRALVYCRVGIAQFDCDASPKFLAVSRRPDAGQSLNKRGFSMVHVPNCSDVDFRLSRQLPQKVHLTQRELRIRACSAVPPRLLQAWIRFQPLPFSHLWLRFSPFSPVSASRLFLAFLKSSC